MKINTETHYRVVFDRPTEVLITLVGVGGTGSALAIDLARLAYHCREKGTPVYLQLVDPDTVEAKNVGRQQFAPFEIGRNKAESMAKRLNLWLGLDVLAAPASFSPETPVPPVHSGVRRIIVGAVDNPEARAAIAARIKEAKGGVWWVDAGNGEFTGQVIAGNTVDGPIVLDEELSLASSLPAPSVQEPALVKKPKAKALEGWQQADGPDCALMALNDEQSLNVNRLMAVYAAQYVYDIVVRCELTTMRADISLTPPSVNGHPITRHRLETVMSKNLVTTREVKAKGAT
jgi:PRTRC genetic system ThiF family protein